MDDLIFDNQTRQEIPVDMNSNQPGRKGFFRDPKVIIPVVVAALLVIGLLGYLYVKSLKKAAPTSSNVILLIKGPDTLTSGNEAEYHIVYRNGENADMEGVSLDVFYPSGFQFKSSTPSPVTSSGQSFNLPPLKQGQDAEVIVRGKLSGSTGEDKQIQAKLQYSLSNFNSQFLVQQTIHTQILPPNLTMDVNGPVSVVNGQDTTFTVSYTNVSTQDFDNLAIQMTYPDGFSYSSSNPPASKDNNYWVIPHLPQNSSGSLEITGSFTGDSTQDKLVMANLGLLINNTFAPQLSSSATFKIIPSSIVLTLTSDKQNYVKLGDSINYKLDYTNQGTIGLSNLVFSVHLDSTSIDLTRISAPNAIITGSTLTWKAATLSSLAVLDPNGTGEINFAVPVKATLATNLKNQIIAATASVSSDELTKPTKAGDLDLKLISQFGLSVNGDYVSGAAPMQVGQPTIFNMTFILTNLSNDLSQAQIVASLPLPSSTWNNVIVPDSEKTRLTFDPGSGKITWNIDQLSAFVGKFSPALTVSFQLVVTPSDPDRGKSINLLSNIQGTATDTFVGVPIQTPLVGIVSTASINDDTLNVKGTTVQ